MVSNVMASLQPTVQTSASQSNSVSGGSDTYRDMMDRVSQANRDSGNTSSGGNEKAAVKPKKDTVSEDAKGQDTAVEDADAQQKAAYVAPYMMLFQMQQEINLEMLQAEGIDQGILTDVQAVQGQGTESLADMLDAEAGQPGQMMSAEAGQPQEEMSAGIGSLQDGAIVEALQTKATQVADAIPAQKAEIQEGQQGKTAAEAGVQAVQTDKAVEGRSVRDMAKAGKEERTSEEGENDAADTGAQFSGMLKEATGMENRELSQTQAAEETQKAEPQAETEEIMAQLPKDLADKLANQKEVTIQLEPENLGKLVIKASFEDGKAMVSILCTSEKTLELLSSHARTLGSIMESNMGSPTSIVLDKAEENYLNQQRNEEQAQQEARREQEERQHRQNEERRKPRSEDFLAQLRLGLV